MINYPSSNCKNQKIVLTMGTFDGVHVGHQKLLEFTKKRARLTNSKAVVLTYYTHPRQLFDQNIGRYLLCEKDFKEQLLKQYGIDCVLFLNFDYEIAQLSAEEFLKKAIIENIGATEVIAGYDTHFGKNRTGGYDLLNQLQDKYNYKAFLVEPYKINNQIVSSSLIRNLISNGEALKAQQYLGRFYSVFGKVMHGRKLGRTFGFPTVNIKTSDPHKLIPKVGVYFVKVIQKQKSFSAVCNIGYSPTVKMAVLEPEIEAFLLDFEGDLYDKTLEVKFIKRLRNEIKFDNKNQLITAINNDVKLARQLNEIY